MPLKILILFVTDRAYGGFVMALSDIKIKAAKPLDKPYKLSDSGGLYLIVNRNGSKYWRMKYRFAGKEKMRSIGVYSLLYTLAIVVP